MNFAMVKQANGQRIDMFATLMAIGPTKQSRGQSPKWYQNCNLRDDNGQTEKVTVYQGEGQLLTAYQQEQRFAFTVQTYPGRNGIGYSGYWKNNAQVNQPQQRQQQINQPAPQQNGEKEMRIVRGNALDATMLAAQIPTDAIGDYLVACVQFILTGKWEISPRWMSEPDPMDAQMGDDPGGDDPGDEVPF